MSVVVYYSDLCGCCVILKDSDDYKSFYKYNEKKCSSYNII